MQLLTEKTSVRLIWIGLFILVIAIILFMFKANLFKFDEKIDSEKFDHFGSLIGGFVGSIWTLSSIILFYIALTEQRKATEHQREAIDDQKRAININIEALQTQVESLKIQSKEFELQREELAQTRHVFLEQSKTLKLQQFESTFFSMLNLHHQIVNSMDTTKTESIPIPIPVGISQYKYDQKDIVLTSRDCFEHFYEKMKDQFEAGKKGKIQQNREVAEKEELIKLVDENYLVFYGKYQSDLGHYFRNLYNILKFIHQQEVENKLFYSNLLRAQLSVYELLLLFYNGLSKFGVEKFKPLIEEYHFLQNMPQASLINRNHIGLYDKKAFFEPK